MNVMLCESSDKNIYNAAKARKDTREIVKNMGYRDIVLFHNKYPRGLIVLEIIINSIRAVFSAKKEENIFFQYPYYPSLVNKIIFFILRVGKKVRRYKTTMIIHDVVALRSGFGDLDKGATALHSEISAWTWIDNVICHTENMKKIFEKIGVKNCYSILGPFYFLYDGDVCKRKYSENPVVMIAGALSIEKCKYVYELSKVTNVRFDLFGTNYIGIENEQIKYRGKFDPKDLISHLDGQFGLVWDGESVETCSGNFGNYLKYNSPHKFSLYLAAGVPLIVWKESALARYVKDNGIGICLGSLTELNKAINSISEEEYIHMCENVMVLRKDIICGINLENIINKK